MTKTPTVKLNEEEVTALSQWAWADRQLRGPTNPVVQGIWEKVVIAMNEPSKRTISRRARNKLGNR